MTKIRRANRKKLTPKERTQMWAEQKGLCGCGCGEPLRDKDEGIVGEHVWWFVALGNSGKPDKLYRKPCARKKTNGPRGDINTIAHIKRLAEKRTQADHRDERGYSLIQGKSKIESNPNALKKHPTLKKQMGSGKVVQRG